MKAGEFLQVQVPGVHSTASYDAFFRRFLWKASIATDCVQVTEQQMVSILMDLEALGRLPP